MGPDLRATLARLRPGRLLPVLGIATLAGVLAVSFVTVDEPPAAPQTPAHVGISLVPRFGDDQGWRTWTTGPTTVPLAAQAIAANHNFDVTLGEGPPVDDLQPDDILVWAVFYEAALGGPPPPPTADPPTFAQAEATPTLEGTKRPGYFLRSNIGGDTVEFRVFFGRHTPTARDRQLVDEALERFTVTRVPISPPRIALLEGPQTDRDRVLAAEGWVLTTSLVPESIRFAREVSDAKWLTARTTDGRICIVSLVGSRIRSACVPPKDVAIDRSVGLTYQTGHKHFVTGRLLTDGMTTSGNQSATGANPADALIVEASANGATTPVTVDGVARAVGMSVAMTSALRFSVLEGPRAERDALPPAVLAPPTRIRPGIGDPLAARWAVSTSGDISFWIAPGESSGILCLVANRDQTACGGTVAIEEHGALVFPSSENAGSWWRHFAAIVPDGYEVAAMDEYTMPVIGNVAFFPHIPSGPTVGKTLILTGPAGRRDVPL